MNTLFEYLRENNLIQTFIAVHCGLDFHNSLSFLDVKNT